jgi:hypothetical protein
MMDCTHPARPDWLRITDATESVNCPDFDSLLSRGRHRVSPWRVLRTALVSLVLVGGAMYAVVRGYEAAVNPAPPVLLEAAVSVPSEATRDSGFDVKILVRNAADYPANDVQVFLSGPSLPKLTCTSTDPPDAFIEATPRSTAAWIGRIEPGGIGAVQFHFTSEEPFQVKLVAQVVAANLEGPQKVTVAGEILP